MNKVKVSIVSYLNTVPFVYGLEESPELKEQMLLSKDIPSECARKLITGEIDMGLVPVAIIPRLKTAHIVSDYCIGATGKVKSVLLVSEVPLTDISHIFLDYQSRTSVELCQILCREHWKISPQFIPSDEGYEKQINGTTAGVIIGDRTFNLNNRFKYCYDLADEWKKMTTLPFVFATWVSNKTLPESFIDEFNKALQSGLDQTQEAIDSTVNLSISKAELQEYLTKYIRFTLDESKKEGLSLFLKKLAF